MKRRYEAWDDPADGSISLQEAGKAQQLSQEATLIYRIEADTYEEACAIHHIKMGWEPYVPMGAPQLCPNGCGSIFYPEGSGQCPKCGDVG